MYLETPKKKVNKSSKEVFDFLNDVKNFETLMPKNISKFEVINENRFLFALTGMPEIVLQKKQQTPHSQLTFGAASDKLPFTLTADILAISDDESEVTLSFEGEFNAMMAMMIKSPINNFIGTLSDNLSKL
ncbi:orotate phosphoribosyltransferase [Arenibacter sp. N53]|uniref:orotate phosphoribosyltransferase n=1 Tax=Arenibacter TaxID=178469 RepID=UPI000CD48799|nr:MULTISPECIES: orotate phosphoribosyltransferase [Arenibacter]MCM4153861.1 orotate phosphoribosyltransferase [Arenibacter sp. N53]